jgi:hypothetical protein
MNQTMMIVQNFQGISVVAQTNTKQERQNIDESDNGCTNKQWLYKQNNKKSINQAIVVQ